jgi:hypothetical protein
MTAGKGCIVIAAVFSRSRVRLVDGDNPEAR